MGVVNLYRKDTQPFAQIPNTAIRDPRITPNAFRLLAYLMSHQDGYELSYDQIEAQTTLGRFAINQSAKLLQELGWISVERTKLPNGQFGRKSWTILDPSTTVGHSTMESPHMEQPTDNIRKPSFKENHLLRKDIAQDDFEFEAFWAVYPRKVGKEAARKAFERVEDSQVVLDGARRLRDDPNLPEPQFVPYPATWLNRAGWLDEPYPERVKSKAERDAEEAARAVLRREAELRHTEALKAESEAAKARMTPPPICGHGEKITKCRKCLLGID